MKNKCLHPFLPLLFLKGWMTPFSRNEYSGASLDEDNPFQRNRCTVKSSSSDIKKPIETHWKPFHVFQWAKYLLVQRRSSTGRAFLGACAAKMLPKNSGEPFWGARGHFENPTISCFDHCNAKNRFPKQGTDCREANFPHRNIIKQIHRLTK